MTIILALLLVTVRPQVCQAPCQTEVRVRVERHPDNRWVVIEIDGERFFRSSHIELYGSEAPLTQPPFVVKDIPQGTYDVKVILYQQGKNEVERKVFTLKVAGFEGSKE